MGIIVDKITKSYHAIAAVPASEMRSVDSKRISPALKGLLEAFEESANSNGVPTEIVVRVSGREDRIYSVVLNETQDIQEILQWAIVADD
jgi:hypothetical protein